MSRDNYSIALNWAKQSGAKKGSNFFWEDRTIYRFGHHFPIATIVKREKTVLFYNYNEYGNSTSRHKNNAWGAAIEQAYKIINVPCNPTMYEFFARKSNFKTSIRRLEGDYEQAAIKAVKGYADVNYKHVDHIVNEVEEFCSYFKCKSLLRGDLRRIIIEGEDIKQVVDDEERIKPITAERRKRRRFMKQIWPHLSLCGAQEIRLNGNLVEIRGDNLSPVPEQVESMLPSGYFFKKKL